MAISFSSRPDVSAHVAALIAERPQAAASAAADGNAEKPNFRSSAKAAEAGDTSTAFTRGSLAPVAISLVAATPAAEALPVARETSAVIPTKASLVAEAAPAASQTAPAAPGEPFRYAEFPGVVKSIMRGEMNAEQFQQSFARLLASEKSIKAELGKKTMKELAPRGAGGLKKPQVIDRYYTSMLQRYAVKGDGTVSYVLFGKVSSDN